jgi:hypothetical protein
MLQVVLEQIPGEFMAELKTLDQALLLQFAQRPLPGQLHAALQHLKGPLELCASRSVVLLKLPGRHPGLHA